jgi:spore germination protein GerM
VRRPQLVLVAALATLGVVAAGCAIPTQNAPSVIASSKVPSNLMDPHPPTTSTTQPNAAATVPVKVYFVNASDQFVPATRVVPPPAPLIAVVRALLGGVTRAETAQSITTAIPSDVSVLDVTTEPGNVVTVNLNGAFGEITGSDSALAVGQIVWTVTNEVGLTTGVVFEIEGQRISVPIANGSLVAGPVYLLQFYNVPAT